MEIFQIILLFAIFLVMSFLMFLRKVPALLALPIMAFLIPLACGVSVRETIQHVIGEGSLKLHNAYTIAMFGSMLSVFLQKTGIAESFVKKGAELSGDKPWTIALLMLVLIVSLFTTLGGLGAIIMVATIVLPIMASAGIGPVTIVGIFLLGISIGGTLNPGNWAVYMDVMKMSMQQVRSFALVMFALAFITSVVYITVQLYRDGHDLNFRKIVFFSLGLFGMAGMVAFAYFRCSEQSQEMIKGFLWKIGTSLKYTIGAIVLFCFFVNCLRVFLKRSSDCVFWTAYFTPAVPLFLILLFDMDVVAALICGLIYGVSATYRKGTMNLFIKSVFEGGGVVMPAVALMFGIGMLLNAIMGPGGNWDRLHPEGWPVIALLKPLMGKIVPTGAWSYVLVFTLAAPLALYRGPLNVWGMGYGLAAVFLASGLNPGAVMGLLLSVGQIQGISDPTNTQNVWLANEMRVDVQKILWNTLPYTWIIAFLGLVASSAMFMG